MPDRNQRAPARTVLARLRPITEQRPAFVEGLLIGAMVGAAIAGSTVWSRLRRSRAPGARSFDAGPPEARPEAEAR